MVLLDSTVHYNLQLQHSLQVIVFGGSLYICISFRFDFVCLLLKVLCL